jgi:hypothetical protein
LRNGRHETEIILKLREAIVSKRGLPAAVTRFETTFPMAFGALFVVLLRRQFGANPDIRAITWLVAQLAHTQPALPRRRAEAIIRGALGEPDLAAEVEPGSGLDAQVGQLVVNHVLGTGQLDARGVSALLDEVTEVLADSAKLYPDLVTAADEWKAVYAGD